MNKVYGYGINDMPRGWASKNKWNKRVYRKWCGMLERCYSEKYHKKQPTYINCTVCERWIYLSNFLEDFKKIDGYDEEKFLNGELELDKDIKMNGKNKEYSLNNCLLVSKYENVIQSTKTRNYATGENHHSYGKPMSEEQKQKLSKAKSIPIQQIDKKTGEIIKIWNSATEVEAKMRINQKNISSCCKWYECGENLEEWYKTHKIYPVKSAGGYIWKYWNED